MSYTTNTVRVLMLGDIFGETGKKLLARHIDTIRTDYRIDITIANGENSISGNGLGITPDCMKFFNQKKVDAVTSGNHVFDKKEIVSYFATHTDLIRPVNYPSGCPGKGYILLEHHGVTIAVVNVMGRVFMPQQLDCPFRAMDTLLTFLSQKTKLIFVDFHAETTSEKLGLAYYLDGKISALVGTHTHVQTNDARVLPGGTAYITDLGMSGSLNSMIGVKKDVVITKYLTQMPAKFEVDTKAPYVMSGVVIEVDKITGKAIHIEKLYIIDEQELE